MSRHATAGCSAAFSSSAARAPQVGTQPPNTHHTGRVHHGHRVAREGEQVRPQHLRQGARCRPAAAALEHPESPRSRQRWVLDCERRWAQGPAVHAAPNLPLTSMPQPVHARCSVGDTTASKKSKR